MKGEQATWFRHDPEAPLALVFSGGGARGAFQVGVWRVLRERVCRRAPDVISGTSCGAINGALIAAGLTPQQMLDFWLEIAARPPVIANEKFFSALRRSIVSLALREPVRSLHRRRREGRILGALLRRHRLGRMSGWGALVLAYLLTARFDTLSRLLNSIPTPYLFDATPLKDHLRAAIGGEALHRTKVRLAINAVDLATGRVVRFVNHPPHKSPRASVRHYRHVPAITLDMILASASIPLVFNSVRVDDLDLWDGGLLVNSPLAPAVALGAKRIVPVLVTAEAPAGRASLDTLGDAVERLVDTFLENAFAADRKLLLDRNALAGRLPDDDLTVVELMQAIRPRDSSLFDAGSYIYFERRALLDMHEAGRRAAHRWLASGPRLDHRGRSW